MSFWQIETAWLFKFYKFQQQLIDLLPSYEEDILECDFVHLRIDVSPGSAGYDLPDRWLFRSMINSQVIILSA